MLLTLFSLLLHWFQTGGTKLKLSVVLALGWSFAPIIRFVEQYVFSDWAFMVSLTVVIAVDTILGIWLRFKRKEISSKGFARLFPKLAFYSLFLVAIHAVAQHRVNGELNTLLTWIDSVAYATIMSRELLSIFEKSAAIGFFKPPTSMLSRLKLFNEKGEFTPDDNASAVKQEENPHA